MGDQYTVAGPEPTRSDLAHAPLIRAGPDPRARNWLAASFHPLPLNP